MNAPFFGTAAALLLALAIAPRARAEIQHVIAISVDGLRGDFLRTFLETAPPEFPNFVRLRDTSACTFSARCDFNYSLTIPDHLCMVTGRPVQAPEGLPSNIPHGITSNGPGPAETAHNSGLNAGVYKASIFDVAHDRGLSTALYLTKDRLAICGRSWDATNGAMDVTGIDNGRDKVDYFQLIEGLDDPSATAQQTDHFVASITEGTLRNFTFFHIVEPDYAGHYASGWVSTPGSTYWNSVRVVDGFLGRIFDALASNPSLAQRVAVLLTSDHGGGGTLNNHLEAHKPENYTVPFFLNAPGVPAGSDVYALFENRVDPGTTRPPDVNAVQPMRNGDIANVSAALLGLPSVPGSFFKPELRQPLTIARTDTMITAAWPVYLTGYTLEQADDLTVGRWQSVDASAITDAAGERSHTFTYPPPDRRFFRLRPPEHPPAVAPLRRVTKLYGTKRKKLPLRSSPHRKPHRL